MNSRDIAIRTILGEAGGEGPQGWAAVAHVLSNRARDSRWPSTIADVALQPKQFSTWNTGAGGNSIPHNADPTSEAYKNVGLVYDAVMSGQMADPTGGATHFYSPAGMDLLVSQGAQGNVLPPWLQAENARRGAAPTTIGGHTFTGMAEGAPAEITDPPKGILGVAQALGSDEVFMGSFDTGGVQAPPPPVLTPQQFALQQTPRSARYAELFKGIG